MSVVAIVPARGGSKSIPKKNLVKLKGVPLIQYTLDAAASCPIIDHIFVSTDCLNIARFCHDRDVSVIKRPSSLAADQTPTLPVIQHALDAISSKLSVNYIFTLQPTSPLRTAKHLFESFKVLDSDPSADSLVSCIQVPHTFSPESLMTLDSTGYLTSCNSSVFSSSTIQRRQDKQPYYARSGAAIYITRPDGLKNGILNGRVLPYMMTARDSVDIDTYEDLMYAEYLLSE